MRMPLENIKLKVITGYLLLALLSVVTGIFIYKQVIRLAVDNSEINTTSRKLFIIGNTLTSLYEAETLSNTFILSNSRAALKNYIDRIEQVEINIDSLKKLTHNEIQQSRIDSVNILLERKMINLKKLVQVKASLSADKFYDRAISTIEASKDSIQEYLNISKKTITTADSSYVKSQKRNLWNLLFSKEKSDSSLKVTVSRRTIIDSVNIAAANNGTDSVISILKSVWSDVRQQTESINEQINRREFALINQSAHITEQLRKILGEYEQEEINNSVLKINRQENIVNSTVAIIAVIASVALVLTLLFSFFILRDITRSQRYRKELEAAKKYADQLLESREKLMLNITHDIKSPLGSIVGYIELLNNTQVNERQRYFLENMKGSSAHILNLVTNLLDFSKLESNKMILEEVYFNPMQLFQEICDSFIPLAKSKNLALSGKISEELNSGFQGDALRIRQILVNIMSNAVKYTNKGFVNLNASVASSGKEIILRIEDSGIGMTKDEQELVFKEFTRLSSASSVEGTGLGLTITLRLVHLLGGRIFLDSVPGKGSCFTVNLPLKKVSSPNTSKIGRNLSQEVPVWDTTPVIANEMLPKLNILLVDDDPLQLEMTASLLRNRGIHVDTTTNPGEVIHKLREVRYDMLFSDIQMPFTDGFGLVKMIRESDLPCALTLPVIALSASSGKSEEDYINAGFTAYLNKPFTSDELWKIVGEENVKEMELSGYNETEGYTLKNIRIFADNDDEALRSIVNSFIKDTQNHIVLLRTLQESSQIAGLAHKMLPMFRQMEVVRIIPLLERVESNATKLEQTELKTLITEITKQAQELITRLGVH